MEFISDALVYFSQMEMEMDRFLFQYKNWIYLVLALLFFCETGIIFLSFLPGDSVLLAVGVLSMGSSINPVVAILIIIISVILGCLLNYQLGYIIGKKAFSGHTGRFFNQENLLKAHAFYEKYGGITLILSRFFPVIRAFAPLIAGIGKMEFKPFIIYTVLGSAVWVSGLIFAGMFFGKIPFFRENTLFVITIFMTFILIVFPIFVYFANVIKKRFRRPH